MFFVGQKCKEDSSVIKIGRWGCHRISDTLTSLADIDPGLILSQKFGVLNHLIGLPDLPVHVLDGDEEHEGCNKELCKLMQGNTLPACKDVGMAMR